MSVMTKIGIGGLAAILTISAAYSRDGVEQMQSVAALGGARQAQVVPGQTTKAQVQAMLGAPWRVAQFNDCGDAMAGQADETWEYRGTDASGSFRLHVEFDDSGVAQLVAKIPDKSTGGSGTVAKIGTVDSMAGMQM